MTGIICYDNKDDFWLFVAGATGVPGNFVCIGGFFSTFVFLLLVCQSTVIVCYNRKLTEKFFIVIFVTTTKFLD